MKNLLGLLAVGGIIFIAATYAPEGQQSFYEKMTSKDGMVGQIQNAENAANAYGNGTQRRIDAEFGVE